MNGNGKTEQSRINNQSKYHFKEQLCVKMKWKTIVKKNLRKDILNQNKASGSQC